MKCPNCQAEVLLGTQYCDNCGNMLQSAAPAVENVVMPQATEEEVTTPTPLSNGQGPTNDQQPVSVPASMTLQTPPANNPPMSRAEAHLVVVSSSAIIPLQDGKEILLGRTDPIDGIYPDIDLTPHDTEQGVSRRHAWMHERGGQWYVRDNNSMNYTVVNRRKLEPNQDFLLEDGDEIRFGRMAVIFHTTSFITT